MALTVYYDGSCQLCLASVAWVRRLAWLGEIRYVDVSDRDRFRRAASDLDWDAVMKAMHVRAPDGSLHVGYHGFRELLRAMPLLYPLRPLLGLRPLAVLGERVYAWVARRRYRWNRCEGACAVHASQGGRGEHP
ncbi:MAG: DUF393 domain-containing protein [Gemmatimonadetes bacterium]|nr:DUF393 domain-containing protein [Gemmatimonadota bacterium]